MIKNNNLKYTFFILLIFLSNPIISQNDLLGEIDYVNEDYKVGLSAFKAHKIINGQSTKQSREKELFLYVAHRFGSINGGIKTLFGLDIANTKIEMFYGLSDNFQVGFSRESLKKTYTINFKNKITSQESNFPLNISIYNSFNYNSSDFLAPGVDLSFSQRSLFLSQLLISNRVSEKLSFQLTPSFVKRNYNEERILFENGEVVFENGVPVFTTFDREYNYALGLGASYKINKRTALNLEYFANLNRVENSPNSDAISVGIDIETGGHVFQLIFSNTQSIDDVSVILDAEGDWTKRHIFFGFNILRIF
tara:strand:- start:4909 stop:5832 length:924 start_codon:yes stop_codon:yes gene_type:complete